MTWSPEDVADAEFYACTQNHDEPVETCRVCPIRAQERVCGHCDATLEDSVWYPDATSMPCDHTPEWLLDGFGRTIEGAEDEQPSLRLVAS